MEIPRRLSGCPWVGRLFTAILSLQGPSISNSGLLKVRTLHFLLQDGFVLDFESDKPRPRPLAAGTRVPSPRYFARRPNVRQHRRKLQCLPHRRCRRWLLVHHADIQHHTGTILPLEPRRDQRLRNQLLAWICLLRWSRANAPGQPDRNPSGVVLPDL